MESKQGRIISISGLLLSLIMFSLNPAYGNLDRVRWEDLAEHLSEKSIPLIQLNLCDSPDNMQDVEPDRVVSQVIENTYYSWEEYDITVDADIYMCIVMKKPDLGPLSAQEAQVLLTGSMLWRVTDPDPEPEPEPIPDFIDPVDEEEIVVGLVDSRTRITSDKTESFPWNTYCYLSLKFASDPNTYRGTGCLVGPYMVLTCAHNIYDHDSTSYIEKITVAPGQTQDHKGDPTITPYEPQEIVDPVYDIAPEFPSTNNNNLAIVAYEYAAVFLDKPFPGINTFMPMEFSSSVAQQDNVSIAGYPRKVKLGTSEEEISSRALWDASGLISGIYSDALLYTTDTSGGESGSPIRNRNSDLDPFRIIGVHVGGNEAEAFNAGARLGAHNQALINEWWQWTPAANMVIFEDTFPSTMIDAAKWVADGATVDNACRGEPSSPYSLRLNGNDSVESRAIDLSSYTKVTLTYSYQHRGETNYLAIRYHNGSGWMTLDEPLVNPVNMPTFEKSRPIYLPDEALHANFRLRIESTYYGFDEDGSGDWFIDDVKLADPCPDSTSFSWFYTDFQSGFGRGWFNVTDYDDIDWRLHSGPTSSDNTGPSASDGNYYLYIESSGEGEGFPNRTAILESPCINIPGYTPYTDDGLVPYPPDPDGGFVLLPEEPRNLCEPSVWDLCFDYHMHGVAMGDLIVEVSKDAGRSWDRLWSKSGDQGAGWQRKSLRLPVDTLFGDEIKLRFKGITGAGYTSDIAIDNIWIMISALCEVEL